MTNPRVQTPVYSLAELRKHGPHHPQGQCWFGLFGNIYDATKFSNKHPGGEAVLMQRSGDILDDILRDKNHSSLKQAKIEKMLDGCFIGKLDQGSLKELEQQVATPSGSCVIS